MAENTNKKGQDIELRCDEVQEILTRPPRALVRWGITFFFGVLALIFVGGCFFKYPDTVDATVTVTTEHPPVWMVAKGSGKLKELYRHDRDSVRVGDIIAVLENPAVTSDVLALKEILAVFAVTDSCIRTSSFPEKLALESVQTAYASFLRNLTDYRNFLALDLYRQKTEATVRELKEYRAYIGHLKRQVELDRQQSTLVETVYVREKKIYESGLIAKSEYEKAQQELLSKRQGTEQLKTSLSTARIQEAQLEQQLIETKMEREREENMLQTALKSALGELKTQIGNWELSFLFISPAEGILSYNNVWQKNQYVSNGDKVFSVVAEDMGAVIGKIKLPESGSGKVKLGQRVNISVTGYPYMEFGLLTGQVQLVSLLADEQGMYAVTVSLPQDLCTSYGKYLDFGGELSGTAQILADERSLTARLLSPLRYLLGKYR